MTGLGVAIGPILGGALLESFWWGSLFLALAPIALLAALAAPWAIRAAAPADRTRMDLGGIAVSVILLGSLVYTIIEAPEYGWTDTRTLVGFGAAAIAAATSTGS